MAKLLLFVIRMPKSFKSNFFRASKQTMVLLKCCFDQQVYLTVVKYIFIFPEIYMDHCIIKQNIKPSGI